MDARTRSFLQAVTGLTERPVGGCSFAYPWDDAPGGGQEEYSGRQDLNLKPHIASAETATPYDDSTPTDSNSDSSWDDDLDLRAVVEAWPELPEAIRAGIMAMAQATGDAHGGQG